MLETISLTKRYDNGIVAVNNLNIKINKGEIYCMLGSNGAGKTTTVNLFFNFIRPTSGKIIIGGIDVDKEPLLAKQYLAYVSENVMLYRNFTAIQNLKFFSSLCKMILEKETDYTSILKKVGLPEESFNRKLKTFSKGMRQKCGIAIAIAKNADIVILDEPTSGLDPQSAREFIDILKKIKKDNKSVFMTTHDIFRAKEIADRIGIMKTGSLVKEMNKDEIESADLEKIYLEYVEKN